MRAARLLVEEFGGASLAALNERLEASGPAGVIDASAVLAWRSQLDLLKAVVRGAGFALSEAGAGVPMVWIPLPLYP